MNSFVFWGGVAAVALVAGFAGYHNELRRIPLREMTTAEERIAVRANGRNAMVHPPRPSAASRTVVRPSPDQLYSACAYDLSKGPVVFEGTAPTNSYWSLSFFAHNSDNFFVVNDRQLAEKAFRYVLLRRGDAVPEGFSESEVVHSPSKTGIVLQRVFIENESRATSLDSQRKATQCRLLSN